MTTPTRRSFLKCTAATAAALAVPSFIPQSALAKGGANERVLVGVIGIGGRAGLLVNQLPEGAQVVAVADCEISRCERAAKDRGAKWRMHQNYHKLLEEKDVDAVIVGTPDHVRTLPSIHACQAGKDVYAEKPLTAYIAEGRVLVNHVRKLKRVFQVGSQQRSMEMNRVACEFIRDGGLGKIKLVQGVKYTGPRLYSGLPEQPVPPGFDWDAWLGPTEKRPYNAELHRSWMAWRDYSGGEMTNWGAHGIDQIQWALGMSLTGPVELWPISPGPNGAVGFRYANGVEVRLDLANGPSGGAVFRGEKGNIEINRNKFTDPKKLITNLPKQEDIDKWRDEVALWQARFHLQNWLDCIKTREKPVADVEIGHRSISLCHLANITRELGRKLRWNPEKEQFVDDPEANNLVSRPRRKGYELPEV
jgi:predicted dehydrogenase